MLTLARCAVGGGCGAIGWRSCGLSAAWLEPRVLCTRSDRICTRHIVVCRFLSQSSIWMPKPTESGEIPALRSRFLVFVFGHLFFVFRGGAVKSSQGESREPP
jgi:hypothetical protein